MENLSSVGSDRSIATRSLTLRGLVLPENADEGS